MTVTTACYESWPMMVFWTWVAVTIGFLIGAWWAGGRGERDEDGAMKEEPTLSEALRRLLNRHSAENDSNTPDFILAAYMMECLRLFNVAVCARNEWYSRDDDKTDHRQMIQRASARQRGEGVE